MKYRPSKDLREEVEKAILETSEREQRRIGQELHDSLCQQLTGVALMSKALAQKLARKAPKEAVRSLEIFGLLNQAVNQARDLCRGLSPVELEVDGLGTALQHFAASTERVYDVSCVFKNDQNIESDEYSMAESTSIYRIVQEAVNNSIQHGRATRVVISFFSKSGRPVLTIRDNGVGLGSTPKEGIGLRSMRYRAKTMGAKLDIYSGINGGTVVSFLFPARNQKEVHKREKLLTHS